MNTEAGREVVSFGTRQLKAKLGASVLNSEPQRLLSRRKAME